MLYPLVFNLKHVFFFLFYNYSVKLITKRFLTDYEKWIKGLIETNRFSVKLKFTGTQLFNVNLVFSNFLLWYQRKRTKRDKMLQLNEKKETGRETERENKYKLSQ
jgi:hypothetical protein